jgi:hypothetical protein
MNNKINSTVFLKNVNLRKINASDSETVAVYKTLNTVLFCKEDTICCFNEKGFKKMKHVESDIYSADSFYILINGHDLTLLDEQLNSKTIKIPFNVHSVLVKDNYILIHNNHLESLLISPHCVIYFKDCKIYDLYGTMLLHNSKKNYVINKHGQIETTPLSHSKVANVANMLDAYGGIESFIRAHFSDE